MQKKWNPSSILFLLILPFLVVSCKNESSTSMDEDEIAEKVDQVAKEGDAHLPEDFLDFYDKFHDDIVYQKAHITWPLKGLPSNTDASGNVTKEIPADFVWEEKDWVEQHRIRNDNSAFTQSFAKVDNKMIIERIDMNGTNLRIERRFAKLAGDDWKLIYYMAMNPVKLEVDKILEQ